MGIKNSKSKMLDTIEQYSEQETDERNLVEKVLRSREVFFDTADSWLERKENEEVEQKEERGDREFDYKNSIPRLIQSLSSTEPEKRRKIIKAVTNGISYRITGIYVELNKTSRNNPPFLADVADNPLEYL